MMVVSDSVKKVIAPKISTPTFSAEELEFLEGVVPGNTIEIPEEAGAYLLKKLLVPVCTKMELSKKGPFRSEEELKEVKAVAVYSDGTRVERRIDWEKQEGGIVRGRVHQEHFPAPFAENRADPVCMYRDGNYYFLATNDADNNHTLYMRCSDTLEGIVTAEESLFLDSNTYPGIGGLLWAPEFHEIDGKLYVFHAATSGEFFHEESRVRKLREGGDPICRDDWSEPIMVVKKDGTPLCEEGKVISLDMTVFTYEGKIYAMWSQRQFLPVDQGAWLYLAQIDEKEPWKLLSDPVCIAKPEYGWENNHTYVVEGPFALEKNGQLMVTYAAAAVDSTYTVGLLKPVRGSDILDPGNWRKNNYPLMSSNSVKGQYGPGHNSYL
ncbi:MAG: family 43 glycosylhydrolase, partial [Lachnospiraceae bacterium]|nr:family 43 glycosylhydrolase [Lachnospiraceae bacterium]